MNRVGNLHIHNHPITHSQKNTQYRVSQRNGKRPAEKDERAGGGPRICNSDVSHCHSSVQSHGGWNSSGALIGFPMAGRPTGAADVGTMTRPCPPELSGQLFFLLLVQELTKQWNWSESIKVHLLIVRVNLGQTLCPPELGRGGFGNQERPERRRKIDVKRRLHLYRKTYGKKLKNSNREINKQWEFGLMRDSHGRFILKCKKIIHSMRAIAGCNWGADIKKH